MTDSKSPIDSASIDPQDEAEDSDTEGHAFT